MKWFKAKVTVEVEKPNEKSYDVLDIPDAPHDCKMPNFYEMDIYGTRIICRDCGKEWILERISPAIASPTVSPEYAAWLAEYKKLTGADYLKKVKAAPYPSWCLVTEDYQVKTDEHWIGRAA